MTESERSEALQLLKDVLAIHSVNGRDDEGAVARYLCEFFLANGVEAFVQKIDETHSNVIASLEGEHEGPLDVWNGHLDTVPYGDLSSWDTDPAEPVERDGMLYCRGASDMKSGLTAMAYAMVSFARTGKKPQRPLLYLGTCDEEKGGLGGEAILRDGLLPPCETLLIGEPTFNNFGVAHKGCFWMELHVEGKTCHGAYPEQGCNAVEQGVVLANAIKERLCSQHHPVLGGTTAQITKIEGGVAPNMTPDRCTILMDIRTVEGVTADDLEAMVLELAAKQSAEIRNGGDFRVSVTFCNARRAFGLSEDHPLFKKVQAATQRHCGDGQSIGINFFTDASVLVRDHPATAVMLFGPGAPELAHKPNEALVIEKYFQAIEVYRDLL